MALLLDAGGQANGDFGALYKAFNSGEASLALQTGGSVRILVTRLEMTGAEIAVSGPVPGF